jgi:hypothetical protein
MPFWLTPLSRLTGKAQMFDDAKVSIIIDTTKHFARKTLSFNTFLG